MDEEDLYDEFGNYIGPDLDGSSSENDDDDDDDDNDHDNSDDELQDHRGSGGADAGGGRGTIPDDAASDVSSVASTSHTAPTQSHQQPTAGSSRELAITTMTATEPMDVVALVASGDDDDVNNSEMAIVLHEDKQHYPSAEQVFGPDVRTAVLDEDAMDLETPILEPMAGSADDRLQRNKSKFLRRMTAAAATTDGTTATGVTAATSMWPDLDRDGIYSTDYLGVLLANETTRTRRGVAVVGHLHHGKTSLIDLILEPTLRCRNNHASTDANTNNTTTTTTTTAGRSITGGAWGPRAALEVPAGGGPRWTDTTDSEQYERQMSLVSTPLTALLPDTRGKTFAITVVDCPGHVQFHDESVAALRLMDGAVVVVDVVEGMMMHTEMVLRQAIHEGVPIVLVLNKMDRLIVELKLPPRDAYFKLASLLDQINNFVGHSSQGRYPKLAPDRGNVAFCSSLHGWLFTLESFAAVYLDHHVTTTAEGGGSRNGLGNNLSISDFAHRLWGDSFLDPATRTFQKRVRDCASNPENGMPIQRTFVTFVLEPLYKIYSVCLGEREADVNKLLRSVGVLLNKEQLRASSRVLLRTAMLQFLQSASRGFVDMLVRHVPCPAVAARGKVARCYTGPPNSMHVTAMMQCDPRGPLIIHAVKNYPVITAAGTSQSFCTLGRIYSGSVRPAETVHILGEGYSPQDDEDVASATVERVTIPRGRSQLQVTVAQAGNWVLLHGMDTSIVKTATIVGSEILKRNDMGMTDDVEIHIFAPLSFPFAGRESVMKLAIEPLRPSDLPKMVEGLRRVSKAYPMVRTKVEESGEHVLLGTGELYLDCAMHDLRNVYSDIEVKVSDPMACFRETVVETSSLKCFGETANKRNKLTMIAEPLDDGLAEQMEAGKVKIQQWDTKKIGRFFQSQYNWDLLSSRSVWAFGDSPTQGTNLLMDDTLPSEVDKSLLNSCRNSIVQGFQWAMREGPLCEEPVRGTKIKILDAVLADKPIYRGGGQVIPVARKVVHSSLLTATPRLMEPIYRLDITCPRDIVPAIQPLLQRRRGHVIQDRPIPGTTLFNVKGYLPVLDSFGFETDLRTITQGQAMVYAVFDHWSVVPGDPLDRNIVLHPLEPSPTPHLARELLVKSRRRKGLSDDVSISKFFDEGMKAQLLATSQYGQQEQQLGSGDWMANSMQ